MSKYKVGKKVRSLREFSGVKIGTEGWIIEDYGTGLVIAWDTEEQPFPKQLSFQEIADLPAIDPRCPLRDGFALSELSMLELVN